MIQMEYLYPGRATKSELKYLLVMSHDLTSYSWLLPTEAVTDEAAEKVVAWIWSFRLME